MITFKIPYIDRNKVLNSSPLNLKWNKKEKVWQCEDTLSARYHISQYLPLRAHCEDDHSFDISNKYQEHARQENFEAWKHQADAFNVVSNLDNAYLYMLPGSGKTKVMIDYHNTAKPQLTLIVCPKNVIKTWDNQFKIHGINNDKRRICLLEKGTSDKKNGIVKDIKRWSEVLKANFVIIVNYETVWRLPDIASTDWDLIIFDEIHRLQSSSSNVTRFCSKLKGSKKVGLTGTPGEPPKWHGQFLCLDKNLFGTNRKKYFEHYFKLDYFGNPKTPRNMTQLKEVFSLISHVVDNQDVLDIPEPTHTICNIPQSSKREYKKLETEFMLEVEAGQVTVANAMVKSLKLRQICSGFLLDENRDVIKMNSGKCDYLKEMLIDNQENIVIFYNFKNEAEQIKEVALRLGRPYAQISGDRKDMDAIDNPIAGTTLAIQIRAGGTGIDGLQNNYRHCVYYSLSWSEIDHEQSMRRLWRAGQKESVHFYYFIMENTLEEKVFKSLESKQNVIREVLSV